MNIKGIAKLAGVSEASVSYVLNNKPGVSEETKEKILKIIESTNYTPNQIGRRLKTQKSHMITVAFPLEASPFDNLFYLEIIKAVMEKCGKAGYSLSVCSMSDDMSNGEKIPRELLGGNSEGVIFFQSAASFVLTELENQEVPFVIVDAYSAEPHNITVTTDNEFFIKTALKYLKEKGHTEIALITSRYLSEYYSQTYGAYKREVLEINANIPREWVQTTAEDERSAYECMKRIVGEGHIPTAVFCAGDIYAVGAMKSAADQGYKIPGDISFMGIDDILISPYTAPPLTTINIDKKEMGNTSIDLLFKMIRGEKTKSVKIKTYRLIERGSVKDMRGASDIY